MIIILLVVVVLTLMLIMMMRITITIITNHHRDDDRADDAQNEDGNDKCEASYTRLEDGNENSTDFLTFCFVFCTTQKATVERKDTLVSGDSNKCRKRTWRCVREQGTSRITCMLNGESGGVIMQRSEVIATDYLT